MICKLAVLPGAPVQDVLGKTADARVRAAASHDNAPQPCIARKGAAGAWPLAAQASWRELSKTILSFSEAEAETADRVMNPTGDRQAKEDARNRVLARLKRPAQ